MGSSSLADRLIERMETGKHVDREFSIESAADIIFSKHPAIYKLGGQLYHEHSVIRCGDKTKLYGLIDMHDAKLTQAQAIWLYNRLYEMAPELDERYLLITTDYLWDKKTASVVPVDRADFVSTKDRTTFIVRRKDE
jgi:hypothetical protein